jgi:hypothetical protein
MAEEQIHSFGTHVFQMTNSPVDVSSPGMSKPLVTPPLSAPNPHPAPLFLLCHFPSSYGAGPLASEQEGIDNR